MNGRTEPRTVPGTQRQLRQEAAAAGARGEARCGGRGWGGRGAARTPEGTRACPGRQPPVLPPRAPTAPHLGVHVGQAVPAELVEEPLALEVVHDHGHELRIPGTRPRAASTTRAWAGPGARRRRRRLRLRRGRRRRGRRRLRLRVGGHGGLGREGAGPGERALLGGGGCTGGKPPPVGSQRDVVTEPEDPEQPRKRKGTGGREGKGGDNGKEGLTTGAARGQFRPRPVVGALVRPGCGGSGGEKAERAEEPDRTRVWSAARLRVRCPRLPGRGRLGACLEPALAGERDVARWPPRGRLRLTPSLQSTDHRHL